MAFKSHKHYQVLERFLAHELSSSHFDFVAIRLDVFAITKFGLVLDGTHEMITIQSLNTRTEICWLSLRRLRDSDLRGCWNQCSSLAQSGIYPVTIFVFYDSVVCIGKKLRYCDCVRDSLIIAI